jgi:hypothetical protein
MRNATAILIATLALAAPAYASGPPTGADATWDWYWQGADTPAATAADEGLGTVYLYAEGGFDAKVTGAIAGLRAEGADVEALAGEYTWARPGNHAGLLEFVRAARAYQRNAPPAERLAAIHLDIEPYALRMWDSDRPRLMRSYLRALAAATGAAGPLPVDVDIPYWYDGSRYGMTRPILDEILRRVDAVTVMDYRDSGTAAIASAREEVRAAAAAGKRATIGLETGDVHPASVTFFQEGREALTEAVAQIRSAYSGDRGFGGIALHDAASLAAL